MIFRDSLTPARERDKECSSYFHCQGARHEQKNISTQPHQAQTDARFSRAHGHSWRAGDLATQARQGPQETGCLKFRREHRLTDRRDFLRCYDVGRRFFSSCFVLFAARRGDGHSPWRLGLAVSKKIGCATRRNRVRRLIRECFRLAGARVPGGYDYVVAPKRGIDPRALGIGRVRADLLPLLCSLDRKTDSPGRMRKRAAGEQSQA